jgi:hypothetical protein
MNHTGTHFAAHPRWLDGLRWLSLLLAFIALTGCGQGFASLTGRSGPVTVDIAYLGHPPVKAVLADVDKVLASYGDKVQVSRHDVSTPEGTDFLKSRGIADRTVLAIFVNGSIDFSQNGRQVRFFSFPVGRGTEMTAAGNWTVSDLEAALAQAAGSKL